jgi:hypothetical protein
VERKRKKERGKENERKNRKEIKYSTEEANNSRKNKISMQ